MLQKSLLTGIVIIGWYFFSLNYVSNKSVINEALAFQDYYELDYDTVMIHAENKADSIGRKILYTGREMTVINAEILPGGCWDYANNVYNRAGFPTNKRKNIFRSVKKGPYADVNLIQYGDWLYYINHSYGDIEHSAIFVDWVDLENKQALMLSYGGEQRQQPARYLVYDLSSVYQIVRGARK
jgi:hypothetical protein